MGLGTFDSSCRLSFRLFQCLLSWKGQRRCFWRQGHPLMNLGIILSNTSKGEEQYCLFSGGFHLHVVSLGCRGRTDEFLVRAGRDPDLADPVVSNIEQRVNTLFLGRVLGWPFLSGAYLQPPVTGKDRNLGRTPICGVPECLREMITGLPQRHA